MQAGSPIEACGSEPDMAMGWVDPWVGLGRVRSNMIFLGIGVIVPVIKDKFSDVCVCVC